MAPQPVELWQADPANCCSAAKVEQLDRALVGKLAWMSGLRRAEAPTRATAPIVARDLRGLVKVNPIATWTDADVAGYIADHDVPVNPLLGPGLPVHRLPALHPAGGARATIPAPGAGPGQTRRSAACTSDNRRNPAGARGLVALESRQWCPGRAGAWAWHWSEPAEAE